MSRRDFATWPRRLALLALAAALAAVVPRPVAAADRPGDAAGVVPSWLGVAADRPGPAVAAGVADVVLNVMQFGAVGDGSANDVVAIQSAIDTANAGGGGTVFLPTGVYAVGGPVLMRSNVVLQGTGEASVILADGDHVGVMFLGTPEAFIADTIVRDLTVRGSGNPAFTANTLISMNRYVQRAWVDRAWLDAAGYDAWHALHDTRQISVTRSRITGAGDDGLNPGGNAGGGPSEDIVLSHNVISGVANDGVHISVNSRGVRVTGNTILDSGAGIGIFNSSHGSITDNVIRNCGVGILDRADGAAYFTIARNLIERPTAGPGIRLGYLHERVEIAGNTILFPGAGIFHGIEDVGGRHVTIRDNVIQGAADGIHVALADHPSIVGNIVTDAQNGVVMDASDGIVSGNNIVGVIERGIVLPGGSGQARNLVSGNVIRDVALQDGVRVISNQTVITGNHVFNVASRSIADFGLNNTVVNNYVDALVTVGPTARVIHFDATGKAGFGTAEPRHAVDVRGDIRADALRLGANQYRVFAGADGLYIENLLDGTVGRIQLVAPGAPQPTSEGGNPRHGGRFVEVDRDGRGPGH